MVLSTQGPQMSANWLQEGSHFPNLAIKESMSVINTPMIVSPDRIFTSGWTFWNTGATERAELVAAGVTLARPEKRQISNVWQKLYGIKVRI